MIGSRTSVGGCEKIPDASVSKILILRELVYLYSVCDKKTEIENVWNSMEDSDSVY